MEAAIEQWIRREGINRAIVDGRIPVKEYQKDMQEMEKRWFIQVRTVGESQQERQTLCDSIADEAEAFFDKWLSYASKTEAKPMGSEDFQAFWKKKNSELGKDRRMAL